MLIHLLRGVINALLIGTAVAKKGTELPDMNPGYKK